MIHFVIAGLVLRDSVLGVRLSFNPRRHCSHLLAQPNTHVLYLIHQTLSLKENIYEILFQAQNPELFD